MANNPQPCVNDIWKPRDPRRESYFKIVGIVGANKPRRLVIRTCDRWGAETSIDRMMSESRLLRCDLIVSEFTLTRGPNGGLTLEQGTPLPLEKEPTRITTAGVGTGRMSCDEPHESNFNREAKKPFFEPSTSDAVVPPLCESVRDAGAQAMARDAIDRGIATDERQRRNA